MNGRSAPSLYCAFTNIAPGVDEERFHRWYEELHRPDSIEAGMFTHSSRYEAVTPSPVRFLTLWEGNFRKLEDALRCVREGAHKLKGEGRIWPVQTVIFQQFVFAPAPGTATNAAVRTLTTLMNDWAHPARGQDLGDWQRRIPAKPLAAYHSSTSYASACYGDGATSRCLWLGESSAAPERIQKEWESAGVTQALAPFGAPIPIFVPEGPPPPAPRLDDASSDPAARERFFAVHWKPTESRYRSD
jgi:hypothetical protein